ncbi:MAG: pgdA 2 [Geminicoccaceae bacterium]|jgi:putative urate catabolism protein|nr:pgdA 2 [Geminicoccaceae bacterium]
MSEPYPRDLVGYGAHPPDPNWPNGARVALSIVLNYEEGGEASVLHGDPASETYLHEVPGLAPLRGERNLGVESVYEYGARAGFWRILRLFRERDLTLTVYAVGMALERNPEAGRAMVEAGFEVASHGWRWIDYQHVAEDEERAHLKLAIAAIERVTGSRPVGWYTGRTSPRTRRLVVEEGGFLYDSDSYADDLPYWLEVDGRPHLVIPYTLDNNDMKFALDNGFNQGEDFFGYLRDAFDVLYEEGARQPKMMSVGLHCRLVGRPGRAAALTRFLDYARSHDHVWITTRAAIARHWRQQHPHRSRH